MKVKVESEKVCLKLNIQKTKIMASDPITSREIDGETVETVSSAYKFGLGIRNEAGQRLIEFCPENALVITNTLLQQHKRGLYTWTSPDGQH